MKKVAIFLMTMLMAICMVTPAFAAGGEDVRTGTAAGGNPSGTSTTAPDVRPGVGGGNQDVGGLVNDTISDLAPNVTTNDIVDRLETKGNDVVTFLKTIGKYVCIGAFVICCILTIIGIIGNHRLLWAGVLGMIISGLAYAGIVCSQEIVNWIATWAIS